MLEADLGRGERRDIRGFKAGEDAKLGREWRRGTIGGNSQHRLPGLLSVGGRGENETRAVFRSASARPDRSWYSEARVLLRFGIELALDKRRVDSGVRITGSECL